MTHSRNALLKTTLIVVVAYFLGRFIARTLPLLLGEGTFADLENATGIPALVSSIVVSCCAIGISMSWAITAQIKQPFSALFSLVMTIWVALASVPLVWLGLQGHIDPRFILLGIPLTIAGAVFLTLWFVPEVAEPALDRT